MENVKICCTCHEIKKITEFWKKKSAKDGLDPRCKKCNYEHSRKWLSTDKGKRLMQKLHRNKREELKRKIFEQIGNKCVKCGFSDLRALQIDHINGGGNKIRKKQHYSYHRFLLELSKGIGIEKVQILCANCNQIKKFENKEHPSKYE